MSQPSTTPRLSNKAKRVIRTAIGGFISGAMTVLIAAQASFGDMNWDGVKVLAAAAGFAGLSAAWSAVQNYVLDPSAIPSLALAPEPALEEAPDAKA